MVRLKNVCKDWVWARFCYVKVDLIKNLTNELVSIVYCKQCLFRVSQSISSVESRDVLG